MDVGSREIPAAPESAPVPWCPPYTRGRRRTDRPVRELCGQELAAGMRRAAFRLEGRGACDLGRPRWSLEAPGHTIMPGGRPCCGAPGFPRERDTPLRQSIRSQCGALDWKVKVGVWSESLLEERSIRSTRHFISCQVLWFSCYFLEAVDCFKAIFRLGEEGERDGQMAEC